MFWPKKRNGFSNLYLTAGHWKVIIIVVHCVGGRLTWWDVQGDLMGLLGRKKSLKNEFSFSKYNITDFFQVKKWNWKEIILKPSSWYYE